VISFSEEQDISCANMTTMFFGPHM